MGYKPRSFERSDRACNSIYSQRVYLAAEGIKKVHEDKKDPGLIEMNDGTYVVGSRAVDGRVWGRVFKALDEAVRAQRSERYLLEAIQMQHSSWNTHRTRNGYDPS